MAMNPSAMQEIWVQPLGQKDPLKEEMATHSSIFAWENPMEEPGELHSMGWQWVDWAQVLDLGKCDITQMI